MGSESGVATSVMPQFLAKRIKAASVVAGAILAAGLGLGLPAQAHADITPHHDSMITTNACEDILLGWSDGQIIDNLSKRYGVSSKQALDVVTEMRMPGNCEYDENF
jgi:hypothetical protein